MILGATDIYTVTFKHEVSHRVEQDIVEFETVDERIECWDYEIRVDLNRIDVFLTMYEDGLKYEISCQDVSDVVIQDNVTGKKFGLNHPNDIFWKVE